MKPMPQETDRIRIGIVRARFNEEYTADMLQAAKDTAAESDIDVVSVVEVPGAHELPVACQQLLERQDVDGVVALAAVIKGATDHDAVLCQNVSKQLLELSCDHGKPVGYGVIGPNVSWAQVEERTTQYAREAVDAVAETYDALQEL